MSGWDLGAAPHPAVAEWVADAPGRTPATSGGLLEALVAGGEAAGAAAAELEALVAAPEAAAEALSPAFGAALQHLPTPPFLIDSTAISPRNPHNSGRQPLYKAAMDAARAAAAVGQRLPPVRPCAVIRIPRVGSPEAERLQCRFHRYLHGTAQAPLPAAVQAARQEEVDRYRRGLAAALQHVASPRDRALLQLLHSGGAYFEVFCCQEALRAVVEVPAAAEIRIAACLGPATSAAAADVAVAAQALSFRGHAASCRLQGRWRRKPCPSEATVWWRREHGAK
jgi:hypothetical protein